ncbi:MAG: ATP-binding protein [bacterium]
MNPAQKTSVCAKCDGYGYIMKEDGAVACECQDDIQALVRLRDARIPERFASKQLETFEARDKVRREVKRTALSYVQAFNLKNRLQRLGIMLEGPVGCGKTHIAVGILKGVIAKGYTGLYYNIAELFKDIRATFDEESELIEDDILERVAGVELLVLDDLGAEHATPFVLDRLYLMINRRYEDCLPLIVTTNCDWETLTRRLSERITSRLTEMCNKFVPFPEEDYRRKNLR